MYCINPKCSHRKNSQGATKCEACGNTLIFYKEGRYRLLKPLSEDLEAPHPYEVFEALDLKLATPRIIKILKYNNEESLARFKQEGSLLRELRILGLPRGEKEFEVTLKDGRKIHCIVMEKIIGLNLDQWVIKHGKVSEDKAISWLRQLVDILDKLHDRHLFHRDIKPANIMLRTGGQLVLIDFGAARQVTQTIIEGRRSTNVSSPGYTPPEQTDCRGVIQSDFFSLGRSFVYLLTGIAPYDLPTKDDKLIWRDKATQINSKEFLNLIDSLMERSVEKRPKNTQEILQRIKDIRCGATPKWLFIGVGLGIGMLIGTLIGSAGMYGYLIFGNGCPVKLLEPKSMMQSN